MSRWNRARLPQLAKRAGGADAGWPRPDYPNVETLAAVIAHSQIVVDSNAESAPRLPAGFDDVDLAVLDWIAAEGRRLGRGLLPM